MELVLAYTLTHLLRPSEDYLLMRETQTSEKQR